MSYASHYKVDRQHSRCKKKLFFLICIGHFHRNNPRPIITWLHSYGPGIQCGTQGLRGTALYRCSECGLFNRLITCRQFASSIPVARVMPTYGAKIFSCLFRASEGKESRPSAVISLHILWIQLNGSSSINDGEAVRFHFYICHCTIGIKNSISSIVGYSLCVQFDGLVKMVLRQRHIPFILEFDSFCRINYDGRIINFVFNIAVVCVAVHRRR
mmetsp:Transcript_42226/g.99036  ORF Transcript_42226/g.99036 Transcript_42226/m.99036 type:complete len:214 (-) Transcript_42226:347-988(-)